MRRDDIIDRNALRGSFQSPSGLLQDSPSECHMALNQPFPLDQVGEGAFPAGLWQLIEESDPAEIHARQGDARLP